MGSSPCGAGSSLAGAPLRICFGNDVGCSKREESYSDHCRRIGPIARLSLGVGKVFSFVNWQQESRRPDGTEHAASRVVLLSRFPGRGLLHWLLSKDESGGDISSSDVFLQLSGASCVGSKARG